LSSSKKCRCGCSRLVNKGKEFINGHNRKGEKLSVETRNRIGESLFGFKHSLESCVKLSKALKGNRNASGKWYGEGKRVISAAGYGFVYLSNHPSGRRPIPEHWLVIERYFGRLPKDPEQTHHVDGNPLNNNVQNLILFRNGGVHRKFHIWGDIGVKAGDIIFDGRKVK
jgi:hypothetical protein